MGVSGQGGSGFLTPSTTIVTREIFANHMRKLWGSAYGYPIGVVSCL